MAHMNTHDDSIGVLAHRLAEQVPRLVRSELRLAQAELAEKGRHAGFGLGAVGAGGALAMAGLGSLTLAGILALALVMPGWAAALIVAAVLLAAAGVLALVGRSQVMTAMPATPERAMEGVREDLSVVRNSKGGTT